MADAGIEAAKHQLASNVVTADYNDPIKTPRPRSTTSSGRQRLAA